MKKFQKGEIATVLTIATLVVIGISSFVSSHFLKNKQTVKSRAQETACQYKDYDECRSLGCSDVDCIRCPDYTYKCKNRPPIQSSNGPFGRSCTSYDRGDCGRCIYHPELDKRDYPPYGGNPNNPGCDDVGCDGKGGTDDRACDLAPTPPSNKDTCRPGVCCMMDGQSRKIIPNSARQACDRPNKCDINGGCNPDCCGDDSDCPAGYNCYNTFGGVNPNGYCQTASICSPAPQDRVTPRPTEKPDSSATYYNECCGQGYERKVKKICGAGSCEWMCDDGSGSYTARCDDRIACVFGNSSCTGPVLGPTATPIPPLITRIPTRSSLPRCPSYPNFDACERADNNNRCSNPALPNSCQQRIDGLVWCCPGPSSSLTLVPTIPSNPIILECERYRDDASRRRCLENNGAVPTLSVVPSLIVQSKCGDSGTSGQCGSRGGCSGQDEECQSGTCKQNTSKCFPGGQFGGPISRMGIEIDCTNPANPVFQEICNNPNNIRRDVPIFDKNGKLITNAQKGQLTKVNKSGNKLYLEYQTYENNLACTGAIIVAGTVGTIATAAIVIGTGGIAALPVAAMSAALAGGMTVGGVVLAGIPFISCIVGI